MSPPQSTTLQLTGILVAGSLVGSIGPGLCLLVGIGHDDTEVQLEEL